MPPTASLSIPLPVAGRALPALPARVESDLTPQQRRVMVVLILALHAVAVYGLLQVAAVRQAVLEAAPMFVDLLAPPEPARPTAPSPPPPPQPRSQRQQLPPPVIAAPQLATAPAPTFTVPVEEAPPAPPPPVVAPVQAAETPPAPPPPPRVIPASAVRFIDPPNVVYPRLSRRNGESGRVLVRAFIGAADGVPRSVRIDKSSGFMRLDEAAVSAVQQARFKPHTENGQPVEGWTVIPIEFELER